MPEGLCLTRQVKLQKHSIKLFVFNIDWKQNTAIWVRRFLFKSVTQLHAMNRKDSYKEIPPLINTGVRMFLWLNQSRAKLIRLLHQHVRWKRDRGRGLGGASVMRSQPPCPLLCNAPFYIFRFPENVHVFANVWLYRHGTVCWHINCSSHQGNRLCYMVGFFNRISSDSEQCHYCYRRIQQFPA